ncbi:MAG: hypothetical protein KIA12_07575 [Varibaculum cambriense]|uniref:hypothetical protein n=1 Tax=Varibaculum cambriense TaxID=184870 RepID=UPI00241DC5E7|nr:hypothetical protein [Varibaculum cambriense]MBS5973330.1 hypothetical protein [Varibaculum cambriense]
MPLISVFVDYWHRSYNPELVRFNYFSPKAVALLILLAVLSGICLCLLLPFKQLPSRKAEVICTILSVFLLVFSALLSVYFVPVVYPAAFLTCFSINTILLIRLFFRRKNVYKKN